MLFLTVILIFTVFPLVYTILASFKTNTEIMTEPGKILPSHWNLENYQAVMKSKNFDIVRMLANSIIYTGLNVLIKLFVGITCGYVFATGRFKYKNIIFVCFTALMFIKGGGLDIYAKFQIFDLLKIPQTLWSLVLLHLFSVPIIEMYLVIGYIEGLPKGLAEAAKIDGCGYSGILFRIYLPLLLPIVATITILSFQASWNEYLMPTMFTLTRPEQRTLIVGLMALKNGDQAATSWNLMLAGSVIAIIPVLVIYAFCNKLFVQGITEGAIKG